MAETAYPSERTALPFVDPYHVTLVRDATGSFSHEMMQAAHELIGPTYAHSILTTAEVIAVLPKASHSQGKIQ